MRNTMKKRYQMGIMALLAINTINYAVVRAVYSVGEEEETAIALNLNSNQNVTLFELKEEAAKKLGIPIEQLIICKMDLRANSDEKNACFADINENVLFNNWQTSGTTLWFKIIPQPKQESKTIKEPTEKTLEEKTEFEKNL